MKTIESHSLVSAQTDSSVESLLDSAKFSTLTKLVGVSEVTARMLKAAQKFKSLRRGQETEPLPSGLEEVQKAEPL